METYNFKISRVFDNYCTFYRQPSEDITEDIEAYGEGVYEFL